MFDIVTNKSDLINDMENKENSQLKLSEVIFLIVITLFIGFIIGLSLFKVLYEPSNNKGSYGIDDPELLKFIENYNYIVDNYYGDINKEDLIKNAISGMLDSIGDPYTTYIDESSSNTFNTTLEGSFQGIGVEVVNDSDNNIIIYSVIEGSPAERAGLKSLDIIKSINGEDFTGKSTSDFVSYVKNSKNSSFELSVLRNNE